MDVREKLVELVDKARRYAANKCHSFMSCAECDHYGEHDGNCRNTYIAESLIANGVTVQEWISVKDMLPEDGETVLIWSGGCYVATIEKGITEEERRKMKSGELPDPEETGWTLSTGYFTTKRSGTYTRADVFGNNKVPYCWNGVNSPMNWFGQDVTYWMPLPDAPKGQ